MRLAQLNAIQVLIMVDDDDCRFIGFHEPNLLSFLSGGNYMVANERHSLFNAAYS